MFKTVVFATLLGGLALFAKGQGYRVLEFDRLPDPATLVGMGIRPVQYVSPTTIVAYVEAAIQPRTTPGLRTVGAVPGATKLADLPATDPEKPETILVEGYPGAKPSLLMAAILRHDIDVVPIDRLPEAVRLVRATRTQLRALAGENDVCWFYPAPDYIFQGGPIHYCPGAMTPYGPAARFAVENDGWDGEGLGSAELTYHFVNQTADIPGTLEWDAVRYAMATWSQYVQVDFSPTGDAEEDESIDISWGAGNHGDGFPFDGLNGTLAHAFFPPPTHSDPIAGDLHFDEAEPWAIGMDMHTYTVALHELGHSLGLNHSSDIRSIMFAFHGGPMTGLAGDDIIGIRNIYAARVPFANVNDRMAMGRVNADAQEDIVLVNSSYTGGAIKTVDVATGATIAWVDHSDFNFGGWIDNTDRFGLADVDGNGTKEAVFLNTQYAGGAILVVDPRNGNILSQINHNGSYGGWLDPGDKFFFGKVDGNASEDLILVNTEYAGHAIQVVDLQTGATIRFIPHGIFNGWMDATDRMLVGDANGDNKTDLIMLNTSYSGGAIYAFDIFNQSNILFQPHNGSYSGWMDSNDRVAVGRVDLDADEDLVLVNTGGTGGAIMTIDLQNAAVLSLVSHSAGFGFGGWMDGCDRFFLNDVNGDTKEDLILVNTSYSGGAVRALNLYPTVSSIAGANMTHNGSFNGLMDHTDRMFSPELDAGGGDLVCVNTVAAGTAIWAINLQNASTIGLIPHNGGGWMDGVDGNSNCYAGPTFKAGPDASDAAGESAPVSHETTWTVYPNPSTGRFALQNSQAERSIARVQVFDLEGRRVYNAAHNGPEIQLDLSGHPQGLYLLHIQSGNTISAHRVVLE